jgi:GH25 family lysozyme M1 (1,4-beta-N-acetylmuramidase)
VSPNQAAVNAQIQKARARLAVTSHEPHPGTPEAIAHPQLDHAGSGLSALSHPQVAAPNLASPSSSSLSGLDVSSYQGNVNWAQVAAAGAQFAYAKATEGTYYTNPYFAQQDTGSYGAGLVRGAYHFANPSNSSGAAQADYFAANGGAWSADNQTLPGALDIEYDPYGSECYGLTDSQMVDWIASFLNEYHAVTGRWAAIYSTTDWWTTCTGNSSNFAANDPLWIARYNTTPGQLPAGWSSYTFWQYADQGAFPGDQDTFNGSHDQLVSLANGGQSNDFSISANPSSLSLAQNTSGTSTISTAITSGSAQTVNFTVSGVPNGATTSLNPTSVTTGASSLLTVNAGSAAPGTYPVTVTGTGTSATHSTSVTVTVTSAPPTVTGVSPNSGPTTGGTAITITGTNFLAGAKVVIGQGHGATTGAIPATNVKVVSSTKITAKTGGGAKAGPWNLFVTTSGGTSAGNSRALFTYVAPPTVTGVSPNSGPTTGGTAITITGTNFLAGAKVVIGQGHGATTGAIPATNVKVVSSTKITAKTGGGAKAGDWNLFVTTTGGTSAANSRALFTYK